MGAKIGMVLLDSPNLAAGQLAGPAAHAAALRGAEVADLFVAPCVQLGALFPSVDRQVSLALFRCPQAGIDDFAEACMLELEGGEGLRLEWLSTAMTWPQTEGVAQRQLQRERRNPTA